MITISPAILPAVTALALTTLIYNNQTYKALPLNLHYTIFVMEIDVRINSVIAAEY